MPNRDVLGMRSGSARVSLHHHETQQWLSAAVREVIVGFGKSPTEQLSNHNEFGSGVFLVCLTRSGRDPAGEHSRERKELH